MADTATVEVKSPWASKVNWTQVVGTVSSILALVTMNKISVPVDQQATIIAVIQGIQSVATWVIKTWFTPTVATSSL